MEIFIQSNVSIDITIIATFLLMINVIITIIIIILWLNHYHYLVQATWSFVATRSARWLIPYVPPGASHSCGKLSICTSVWNCTHAQFLSTWSTTTFRICTLVIIEKYLTCYKLIKPGVRRQLRLASHLFKIALLQYHTS